MSTKSKTNIEYQGVVKELTNKFKQRYATKNHIEAGFLKGKYPDGTPVAMIAYRNEYGNMTTPPRPFFRNAISDNKDKWLKFLKTNLGAGIGADKAFNLAGEMVRGDIVKSINKTTTPPNAPATILKKHSSHPLIDTSFMRASVTFTIKG